MKKIFTLGFMMLFASYGFAQSTHAIDFEPSGVGADWTWTMDQNADNPPLEFSTNPDNGGINSSATAAKFTARQAGNNWALCYSVDDGEFTFDATNSVVKIMVYKPTISNVGIKLEGFAVKEILVANTKINEWEELTFDFSSEIGNTFNRIVVIPDFVEPYVDGTDRDSENVLYFDNIQIPDGVLTGPLPQPATTAPTPTKTAASVVSIYSDTYTDLAGTDFTPSWGQSTAVTFETIGDNNVLKYSGLNYQGTQYTNQNVSGYDYLHIDFWTPNSTDLGIYLIGAGGEVEHVLTVVKEQWVSTDIPLSNFTPTVDLTDVFQFKIEGNGTVWLDNLYFWSDTPTAISDLDVKALKLYPNPVADILRVQGSEEGEMIEIYSLAGSLVKSVPVQGGAVSVADLSRGVYFVKVNGSTTKITKK